MSMDDNQADQTIIDGEIAEETKIESTDATVLLSLEELIKNNITALDQIQTELKKLRQQFEDSFVNDVTYKEHTDKVKEAQKVKAQTKYQLAQQPAVRQLADKVKTLSAELKERKTSLSDYLLEYQRMSGATEIEGNNGELHQIVHEAKLVKRTSRNK